MSQKQKSQDVPENLHRRQLTAGQRAMLAVPVEREFAKLAKVGRPNKLFNDLNNFSEPKTEKPGRATRLAAETIGVNHNYVEKAKKLVREAPDTGAGRFKIGQRIAQFSPAHAHIWIFLLQPCC